ncbi:SDR family oxidoreductase [Alicyclobacillus dauci]|uniref:Peroxisomal trans-2-enoyl-CoA reductase n=1 Tax=Alicyclobacillus dauci TaxID=1475485 RepID=A0ABY6Z003_9BACL|nr:SDR family oxidoreductase [Alicyclobacillus dauci]WAH36199.1 SDR family oxidoreductase [Alicyclobacillus dauci]
MIFRDGLFQGSVIAITGAGTGIGRTTAIALASLGADVSLAGRHIGTLQETACKVEKLGRKALVVPTNIRNPEEVNHFAEATYQHYGKVDVLINNAGGQFIQNSLNLSPNGWKAVVDLNLNGTFYCCQAFGRMMCQQGHGNIINMSAVVFETGSPGMAHSAAARAAVVNLTKTLALELAPSGVRVNCISPGPIASEGFIHELPSSQYDETIQRIPLGRMGTLDEAASVIVFLASEASSFMNGEVVIVDGGTRLRGAMSFLTD